MPETQKCLLNWESTGKKRKTFEQRVLTKLNNIILVQNNHTVMLNKLLAHSGLGTKVTPKPNGWPQKLPLPDDKEFFAWENFLVTDTNYEYAVDYFATSLSSKKYDESTRDILKQLISKNLKRKLNWRGSTKKFGLKQRKTGDMIIEAVRRRHKDTGDKKIVSAISVWLRNNLSKSADSEEGSARGSEEEDNDLGSGCSNDSNEGHSDTDD